MSKDSVWQVIFSCTQLERERFDPRLRWVFFNLWRRRAGRISLRFTEHEHQRARVHVCIHAYGKVLSTFATFMTFIQKWLTVKKIFKKQFFECSLCFIHILFHSRSMLHAEESESLHCTKLSPDIPACKHRNSSNLIYYSLIPKRVRYLSRCSL